MSAIRKDPQNRTNSIIICEMKGDVSVGDSYTLSIGEQSSNYDTIVPTSAIREDSNGKFILIIERTAWKPLLCETCGCGCYHIR